MVSDLDVQASQFLVLPFIQLCKRSNLTFNMSSCILEELFFATLDAVSIHVTHDAFLLWCKQLIWCQNRFFWHKNVMLLNHDWERFIFKQLHENERWGCNKVLTLPFMYFPFVVALLFFQLMQLKISLAPSAPKMLLRWCFYCFKKSLCFSLVGIYYLLLTTIESGCIHN